MSIDVSVVVPVYNTEKYLGQCVDSLLSQTLKNVEFIFVDDGSTDRSVEILEAYQKRDARIQIIKQKNQYAGVARNNGMKAATGKYIIFLDSDDFFEPTMLEETFNCAEENQAEIVVFGFSFYDDVSGKVEPAKLQHYKKAVVSAEQLGERIFTAAWGVPWNRLYLKKFVDNNKLSYQPIRKHNDVFFAELSNVLASRIAFLNKRFVFYRINNANSLQGKKDASYTFLIEAFSALKRALIERDMFSDSIRSGYTAYASEMLQSIIQKNESSFFSEDFYSTLKMRLIPDLFDSEDDFTGRKILECIYFSENYERFLLNLIMQKDNEIERLRNDTVPKSGKDYIVGHFLLSVPRKLKNTLNKIVVRSNAFKLYLFL